MERMDWKADSDLMTAKKVDAIKLIRYGAICAGNLCVRHFDVVTGKQGNMV